MSDSGWECDATHMDGIWYNPEKNIVVFTQGDNFEYKDYEKHWDEPWQGFRYRKENGWIRLYCTKSDVPEDDFDYTGKLR